MVVVCKSLTNCDSKSKKITLIHCDRSFFNFIRDLYKEMDHKPKGNLIDGNLRINSYPQMLWADYFTTYLLHKMIACMAIASCVTLIYATYDIGSLFLSLAALWEVLLTLPITLYIYHQMLGIEQFSPMQLSVVYILFAVGVYYYPAYVFVDQFSLYPFDLVHRTNAIHSLTLS